MEPRSESSHGSLFLNLCFARVPFTGGPFTAVHFHIKKEKDPLGSFSDFFDFLSIHCRQHLCEL